MNHPKPPRKAAETIGFVAMALGWQVHTAVEGVQADGGPILSLHLLPANGNRLPVELTKRATRLLDTIYREALEAALVRAMTGPRLQAAMVTRRMSPARLADISGVGQATIRKYLQETSTPRLDKARQVYNALMGRGADAPIGWQELQDLG